MRNQDSVLDRVPVLVGTHLAPEYINQIWAVDPRVEVLYDPGLVGRPRFACDHNGPVKRTPEQEKRWLEMLGCCEVLLGLGSCGSESLLDVAPRLKWIQSTSAGVGQRAKKMGLTESEVTVTTASGVHATALAEFVLMSMLFFVKDGFYLAEEKKAQALAAVYRGRVEGQDARHRRPGQHRAGGSPLGSLPWHEGHRHQAQYSGSVRQVRLGVDALYPVTELHGMLGEADFVASVRRIQPKQKG